MSYLNIYFDKNPCMCYPICGIVNIKYSLLLIGVSRTREPAKAGTCARDRRALQQLALNVHVKHSDLT